MGYRLLSRWGNQGCHFMLAYPTSVDFLHMDENRIYMLDSQVITLSSCKLSLPPGETGGYHVCVAKYHGQANCPLLPKHLIFPAKCPFIKHGTPQNPTGMEYICRKPEGTTNTPPPRCTTTSFPPAQYTTKSPTQHGEAHCSKVDTSSYRNALIISKS